MLLKDFRSSDIAISPITQVVFKYIFLQWGRGGGGGEPGVIP